MRAETSERVGVTRQQGGTMMMKMTAAAAVAVAVVVAGVEGAGLRMSIRKRAQGLLHWVRCEHTCACKCALLHELKVGTMDVDRQKKINYYSIV